MPPTRQTIRLLVLDRDRSAAPRFAQVLERAGLPAAAHPVVSPAEFTRALAEFSPTVVLANHAADGFGLGEAAHAILQHRPGVPLIFVAEQCDEGTVVRALRSGVEDVVAVDRLERLPAAVEAALAVRKKLQLLSPRQLEVLRSVAHGLTTREIAERMNISIKTIETHRSALMKRLEMHEVATLVRYAVRVGLVPAGS